VLATQRSFRVAVAAVMATTPAPLAPHISAIGESLPPPIVIVDDEREYDSDY
jgi:hypothetical protein